MMARKFIGKDKLKHRELMSMQAGYLNGIDKETLSAEFDNTFRDIRKIEIRGDLKQEKNKYFKFNQLIKILGSETIEKNGVSMTTNLDGTIVLTGKCTAYTTFSIGYVPYIEGHKYLVKSGIKDGFVAASDSEEPFLFVNYGYMQKESIEPEIFTSTKTGNYYNLIYIGPGKEFIEPLVLKPMCIDLTETCGKNYEFYSVYEFERFFPDDYYDYTLCDYVKVPDNGFGFTYSNYSSPSIEVPEEIRCVGEKNIYVYNINSNDYFIINDFTLAKIGNVLDKIIIDGKDKKIFLEKNIGIIQNYNGEQINGEYVSTTGTLSQGATVYYVLDKSEISEITENCKDVLNILKERGEIILYVTCEPITEEVQISGMKVEYWQKL